MILVKTFYAYNDLRNYSYLILDDATGESWVIDPYEANPITDYIKKNGLVLKGILNTHQHFDHIRGNVPLMDSFKAPVRKLKSSEQIQLSTAQSLVTLDTPGHTLDHQVFVWQDHNRPVALFSGDTLFNSGVGNCHGGGDVNLLYATTNKLITSLPATTLLYPGHDYRKRNLEFAHKVEPENHVIVERLDELKGVSTEILPALTLADEMQVNPFLRLNSEELRHSLGNKHENERELFIELRHLRDHW
jgi:hydroxyacylglutathione hydrolase